MGAQKKPTSRVSDDAEELTRRPLQAILLADSFATKFRPITLERPKVLLPLVNVPMINYTLAWLESADVEEVFVFCSAHSRQVIDYLEESEWVSQTNFAVKLLESHNSISAGDALRFIYELNVIHGDFILISGDTVSNISLTQALLEHKERKKKDSNAVMTMVIQQSKLSPITHQSRLGTDELIMAINPDTKQLLFYEEKAERPKGIIHLDNALLADNPILTLHNDKQDCYVDICSPEVLSLFTDNFDYQHLRRHFVKGLLVDDIMGYKIFAHEIHSSYAARIDNYRSYDTVSKDIIQRWTYPFVPDVKFFGSYSTKLEREGMYRDSEVEQSRSAHIGPFTLIGKGTKIGDNSRISNSIIGKGCIIGSNVSVMGSYIWDNVTIEDGCELNHSIVCDGAIIKSGAVLEPGVVLSFKVVIGPKFIVPAYSKVSLFQQPTTEDSDEELEYADNNSGTFDSSLANVVDNLNGEMQSDLSEKQQWPVSELGPGGIGYIWSIPEGGREDEWRHSVAPIPADKLTQNTQAIIDDLEALDLDSNALSPSGEGNTEGIDDPDDNDIDDSTDDHVFVKEVEATFLRAVDENIKVDDVILEMNSLRLSYNMDSSDCVGAIFYAMMKLALDMPHGSTGEFRDNVTSILNTWQKLLAFYAKGIDDQIEVIMKLEELCQESMEELSPLFAKILEMLYDRDIVTEDAILRWAEEKKGAEESDKVFVKQSESFIQWLIEAEEED